jgi:hypothetical protein
MRCITITDLLANGYVVAFAIEALKRQSGGFGKAALVEILESNIERYW